MGRPREIVWFERLMFGSLGLGVFNSWLRWPDLLAAAQGRGGLLLATQFFTLIVLAALYLWISRGRSVVAKWIAVTLFVLGVPFTVLAHLQSGISPIGLIFIVQTLASIIALGLLFTRSARLWFKGEWQYAGIFD